MFCLNCSISGLKVGLVLFFIMSYWVWTSNQREAHFGVIDDMCLNNNFPEKMVFYQSHFISSEDISSD